MSALYTVTATFTDQATAQEWEDWMRNGHMQALLDCGALEAQLIRWTDPPEDGSAIHMTAHYRFPSSEVLETYLHEHAEELRKDGLMKFPISRGITYSRRIGDVLLPSDSAKT